MDSGESGDSVMNQIQRKNPFWSLAGPLFIYLGIQWFVQFTLQMLISLPYIAQAYLDMVRGSQGAAPDMQEMMNTYLEAMEPAFETVMQHQVEIAGVAAAGTLIFTGILFVKDRKLEKACGIPVPVKVPVSSYIHVLILGVFGCVSATCLTGMAQAVFYDEQYQQTAQVIYTSAFPVQLALLGVLIPIAEEMMFRGVLFKRFRERQSFWYSAVCSSIFFAFMHTNTTQMIYAFLLGLMLSYLYEKFGSVKASMLLHVVMNAGSLVFTEVGAYRWLGADPIRMAGAAIGGAFIGSIMFVMIQRLRAGSISE